MSSEKPRDRFYSNPGSQLAPVHEIRIDDNGHKTLIDTGERTDIYAKIKSHNDEVDIALLLTRCEAEGYQILDQKEAISGDVTMVPKSFMEAQQMLQDMENKFNKLPLETRKQFNFNFNEFIAQAGNDFNAWSKKMGIIKELPLEKPVEKPIETSTEKEE